MVLKGFSQEFVSPVAAQRMFKAGVVDAHNLVPRLIPGVVTGTKILEGDGGAGSVKRTDFTDVIPFRYVTDRVEVQDEEEFVYIYRMLEGGFLGKKYSAAKYEVRYEATMEGGCVCKMRGEYEAYDEWSFKDEDIQVGKEGLMGMYKAVEAHLLENPLAYL